MKKNRLLQLVFFAAAMFLYLPAIAQNENVVTLAGNAYITSGHTAFIDEGHNAIRNWCDKATVVSFYFRAQESGKMKIALPVNNMTILILFITSDTMAMLT